MVMTAAKEPHNRKTKTPKQIHLPLEVARQLERAAKATDISQSIYVMLALKDRFKKDGIQ
jgi:hypothetical protein